MSGYVVYSIILAVGCAGVVAGAVLSLHVDHRIRIRGYLSMGVGYTIMSVVSVLVGSLLGAAVLGALAAYFLWHWWNGGGGDGFKRRFKTVKTWAASFGPKTAPQGA